MGEDAFVHADDEDDRVFEALGGVEGDEGDGVVLLFEGVEVGHEGDVFEEAAQLLGDVEVGVVLGDGAKLHDVLPALFAFLGAVLEELLVAGPFEEEVEEADHGEVVARGD